MRKSPFYRDDFVGATQKVVDTRTAQKNQADGLVAVVDAIGAAQVQLRGASNFIPVYTSSGVKVTVGDRVILRRSTETSRWTIYQNLGQGKVFSPTGALSAASSSGSTAAKPTNFMAQGGGGGILFTWTPAAPNGGLIYEIDIADNTSDLDSIIYQVAGASWFLSITGVHYCRIRSVGSDWTRSEWSEWIVSTGVVSGKDIQVNGFDEPPESKLNIIGGRGVLVQGVDDPGSTRTNVTISTDLSTILTDRDGNILVDLSGNVLVGV